MHKLDLVRVLRGASVCTVDGRPVQIYQVDLGRRFFLRGKLDGQTFGWNEEGRRYPPGEGEDDLVMSLPAPIGK